MFGILGVIAIFAFTYFGYKTAVEYGRSPFWAGAVFGTGVMVQFVFSAAVEILIMLIMLALGKTADEVETSMFGFSMVVGLIFIVASIGAMLLILKYLARLPEDAEDYSPPVPPKFN